MAASGRRGGSGLRTSCAPPRRRSQTSLQDGPGGAGEREPGRKRGESQSKEGHRYGIPGRQVKRAGGGGGAAGGRRGGGGGGGGGAGGGELSRPPHLPSLHRPPRGGGAAGAAGGWVRRGPVPRPVPRSPRSAR